MTVDIVYRDIPMTVEVDNSQDAPEILGVIEIGGVNVYDLLNGAHRETYKWDRETGKAIYGHIPMMDEIDELVAAELEEMRHE